MHLIESYALSAGCKISKPTIQLQEIDLPKEKCMTFHGFNPKGQSRQYNSWELVLEKINADASIDLQVVQVGGAQDKKYFGADHSYLGKTSYNSLAYLIKNAELHLGFDSLPMHLASIFDTKIVALFNSYSQNTGPYFSKEYITLEPSYDEIKPCFNYEDRFDLINTIDPEIVYLETKRILEP